MSELDPVRSPSPSPVRGSHPGGRAARPAAARPRIVVYNPKADFFTLPLAFCSDPFVYGRKWVGLDPASIGTHRRDDYRWPVDMRLLWWLGTEPQLS